MKEDGTVNRAALPTIFNPEDLHALETALEIRDEYGGTVTVVTHGPAQGGRRAPRLPVPRGRSGDPADRPPRGRQRHPGHQLHPRPGRPRPSAGTTSCSAAGRRSTATRPRSARSAPRSWAFRRSPTWSSWSSCTTARSRIRRNIGHGWEIVEAKLPVLVTVLETANEPRPPAAQAGDAVEAGPRAGAKSPPRSKPRTARRRPTTSRPPRPQRRVRVARRARPADRAVGPRRHRRRPARCGLAGSPTKVHRMQAIVLTKEGYTEIPPTEAGVAAA